MTKHDEMWRSSFFLWLVVQRTHLALICCSDRGQQMTWLRTHGMGMIGSRKRHFPVKTYLIYCSIQPGALKIWINAESFWVQYPTYITPLSPGLTWAPRAQGDWGWISPNTTSVVSLETTSNSSNTPGCPTGAMYFWQPTQESVWLCQMRAQNCLSSDASHVFESLLI